MQDNFDAKVMIEERVSVLIEVVCRWRRSGRLMNNRPATGQCCPIMAVFSGESTV